MSKVCYVILHYKNIKDTIKCIKSLKETASRDSKFIIVDNGSGDGSGKKLLNLYKDDIQCDILLLEENVGFSKGNNAGYQYAKEKYNPKFIVITNNDVVFYQENFEPRINDIYEETHFDVLGPDIYIPRHKDHQSPLFKTPISIDELKDELEQYRYYKDNPLKFQRRLKLHAEKNMICSKSKLINTIYSKIKGKDILDYRKRYSDVGLQGACLIFSNQFMQQEEKAFNPEPFLYEEEVFLFYRCQKKGYKMVYDPSIAIRHEEAASFENLKIDKIGKLSFMLEHHVKAREELLHYLIEEFDNNEV